MEIVPNLSTMYIDKSISMHANRKNQTTKPQIETVLHVNLSFVCLLAILLRGERPNENLHFSVMFSATGWQIFRGINDRNRYLFYNIDGGDIVYVLLAI